MINSDKTIIFAKHAFIKSNNVWDEFNESMKQPRYFAQKEQYEKYINQKLSQGLTPVSDIHHVTGFIIRKHCEMTNQINEEWYKHIKECGIQCQISFFFVQQMYKAHIYPVEYYDGFYDIYHNDYWK